MRRQRQFKGAASPAPDREIFEQAIGMGLGISYSSFRMNQRCEFIGIAQR
jgi:hypothetical protein